MTAWSECVAGEQPNYSPETIDTAWHAITEWVAPRVLGREGLPAGVDLAAYRIVQEALTNVRRHSAASSADVHLAVGPSAVRIEVTDTGPARPAAGCWYSGETSGPTSVTVTA